jgi:signal peptidase I
MEREDMKESINQKETRAKGKAKNKTRRMNSALKDLLYLLLKIASIVLTFAFSLTFFFGVIRYQEPAMAPAIKDGDLVFFKRDTKSGYQPNDVVAFEINGQQQVKRVVATAGDTVDITEDGLFINGAPQQEPDSYQLTERYADGVDFPLNVPDGQVFVLGDSRKDATDSRVYGCVDIEDTLGKVMAVIRRRNL